MLSRRRNPAAGCDPARWAADDLEGSWPANRAIFRARHMY